MSIRYVPQQSTGRLDSIETDMSHSVRFHSIAMLERTCVYVARSQMQSAHNASAVSVLKIVLDRRSVDRDTLTCIYRANSSSFHFHGSAVIYKMCMQCIANRARSPQNREHLSIEKGNE